MLTETVTNSSTKTLPEPLAPRQKQEMRLIWRCSPGEVWADDFRQYSKGEHSEWAVFAQSSSYNYDLAWKPTFTNSLYPDMPDISISKNSVLKLPQPQPRKAAGPDRISCHLLQAVIKGLAPALTILFQRSPLTSKIPQIWKHALVQPLFQKGGRS